MQRTKVFALIISVRCNKKRQLAARVPRASRGTHRMRLNDGSRFGDLHGRNQLQKRLCAVRVLHVLTVFDWLVWMAERKWFKFISDLDTVIFQFATTKRHFAARVLLVSTVLVCLGSQNAKDLLTSHRTLTMIFIFATAKVTLWCSIASRLDYVFWMVER